MGFSSWGWAPWCVTLGPFFARAPMSDDDEIQSSLTLDMDDAFCARMRLAVAAGLESAPIGVITKPGTKTPKYVPAEPSPLISSLVAMDL
jgi:hypothetical protein